MQFTRTKPLLVVLFLLSGCWPYDPYLPEFPVGEVEGYKPVYASEDEFQIEFMSARPLQHPGKIYVYQHYLLVVEQLRGIHLFDNSNPASPLPLGFLQVAGNSDMAIRGNTLYVNHLQDLVALNITNFNTPLELSRIKQDAWVNKVPPGTGRYFECPDDSKGRVVGWQLTTLNNPTCFR
jgi:hypothetical protein